MNQPEEWTLCRSSHGRHVAGLLVARQRREECAIARPLVTDRKSRPYVPLGAPSTDVAELGALGRRQVPIIPPRWPEGARAGNLSGCNWPTAAARSSTGCELRTSRSIRRVVRDDSPQGRDTDRGPRGGRHASRSRSPPRIRSAVDVRTLSGALELPPELHHGRIDVEALLRDDLRRHAVAFDEQGKHHRREPNRGFRGP